MTKITLRCCAAKDYLIDSRKRIAKMAQSSLTMILQVADSLALLKNLVLLILTLPVENEQLVAAIQLNLVSEATTRTVGSLRSADPDCWTLIHPHSLLSLCFQI